MAKKSNSKQVVSAVHDNGKVQMRYLGNESMADWRVPGAGRAYRVSAARPLFYVWPADAEPLDRFVYRGRKLFEIVPLAAPEPEPDLVIEKIELAPSVLPATVEYDTPQTPAEEVPFSAPPEAEVETTEVEAPTEEEPQTDDEFWDGKKKSKRASK